MIISKRIGLVVLAGFLGFFAPEFGQRGATTGSLTLVAPAEAIVGRPLTPVSVAGVARRTVRRCAAGVYNC